mmetsp:Transcript_22661/g.72913  ORF Transcript_22661/g.72913 Transcript_22661/m.72913 type:complete len:371 (+) Transcript_22661:113-1225(+)|eukprot:CAMPEP_0196780756 /NCGR_PEP_ID=MMETSP1104-20130614/8481_1 /TAXON_ID=33652 /ORGANISM="Cafeteria sp., Strain Caron Lab Isolate" /LENGTH=370 /DNA_ID=CAMNT_0042150971 /DNA_START=93 /DNA_END=1205 /DNA_ORIENTATION=-
MSHRKPQVKSMAALKADASAAYVNSPKGVGSKKVAEESKDASGRPKRTTLRQARRRLSVVSDNKFVEGMAAAAAAAEAEEAAASTRARSVVSTYAGVCKKGYAPYNPRKKNQDSIVMQEHEETGALLLAALDGHGEAGDLVSQFFRDRLTKYIFSSRDFPSDPCRAMATALATIEAEILEDTSIDTEFSGTTAVVACIKDSELFVANVGDSRIILGTEESEGVWKAVPVSRDHKPDLPDERARIEATGGRVFAVEYDDGIDGPARVWLAHMDIPGLAMSRSLGDVVAHTAGVSSEPEVHHVKLTAKDKVLVLGSDGLWEFIENAEVIGVAQRHTEPMKCVKQLADEAYQRWMAEEQVVDDTTVIVAFLSV